MNMKGTNKSTDTNFEIHLSPQPPAQIFNPTTTTTQGYQVGPFEAPKNLAFFKTVGLEIIF